MLKRKDNLTDLADALPGIEVSDETDENGNQQVVGNDGEIITLGIKRGKDGQLYINTKSLELYLQRRDKKLIDLVLKLVKERVLKRIEKS